MLERYFHRHCVVARLLSGPFGQRLEDFAAYLRDRGHARETARLYLWAAEEFVDWLASKKLMLDKVNEQLIKSFLLKETPQDPSRSTPKFPRKNVRSGLRHFLQMLRVRGHAPSASVEQNGEIACLVAEYDHYLRDVAGLALSTRRYRARYAHTFLHHTFGNGPIHWERLKPQHVYTFVADFGHSNHFAAGSALASSLRSFLRWLQIQGHCSTSLAFAIPKFSRRNQASLPRVMNDHQLRTFLDLFDRSTPVGRRDYAMAICQTDLGLRVGEVVALKLDDVDWRSGTIRVVVGKSRRGRVLPLTNGVGQAIADYIQHGRPTTTCRHVFVRHTVPSGSPVTRYLISHVLRDVLAQVKGCEDWKGTHVLRHTAATRLYNRGATLKEIGDILGHRRLDTTAVYTKVERTQLSTVALPWPEEVQQ